MVDVIEVMVPGGNANPGPPIGPSLGPLGLNIKKVVDEENLLDGHVVVYVPHTTAGITINEGADPSVQIDIIKH